MIMPIINDRSRKIVQASRSNKAAAAGRCRGRERGKKKKKGRGAIDSGDVAVGEGKE